MSLLNPWVILGIVLFWGFSMAGAYLKGSQVAQDAARAAYATSLEQTIAEANKNAVIDMAAAAEVAARESAARTRAAMIRGQTVKVIHEKPSPAVCNLDAGRMQLVAAAVAAANSEDAASRVRDAADKANRTGR